MGDGPQRNALESLAFDLGIREKVDFAGFVPNSEVHSFYGRADVFVSMSAAESWGQSCVEALSAGLPVIANSSSGAEKYVREGRTGILVEDERSFTTALVRLTSNRKRLAVMGRAARRDVIRSYDWDTVVCPQYVGLYDELIKNGGSLSKRK